MPGLAALNMPDVPALSQAVAPRARRSSAAASRRASSLVVPDTVAKVSLLKLEKVPAKAADLQEIVRWQMRKTAPFPIEQAVLSISPGARSADGASEFVVSLSRADVIHQYEQACLMAGVACRARRSLDLQRHQQHPRRARRRPPATGCSCTSTEHLPDARRDARQRAVVFPQSRRRTRARSRT